METVVNNTESIGQILSDDEIRLRIKKSKAARDRAIARRQMRNRIDHNFNRDLGCRKMPKIIRREQHR